MTETIDNLHDEELTAVESELTKLRPAAHSPSLGARLEQALAAPRSMPATTGAPLRWHGWSLTCLAAAACLALVAAWHVSRPTVVAPGRPDAKGVIADAPMPLPQSLLAMQRAMAKSDTAALNAVDAAAASSVTSARTSSPLRACNTQDLYAVLDGL